MLLCLMAQGFDLRLHLFLRSQNPAQIMLNNRQLLLQINPTGKRHHHQHR